MFLTPFPPLPLPFLKYSFAKVPPSWLMGSLSCVLWRVHWSWLDLARTSCILHRAAPASPHRDHPCSPPPPKAWAPPPSTAIEKRRSNISLSSLVIAIWRGRSATVFTEHKMVHDLASRHQHRILKGIYR